MKPTETTPIFTIFFPLKWKNYFHHCRKSTHSAWFESPFPLRALAPPSAPLTPDSRSSPTAPDHSHQHPHILRHLPRLCVPIATTLFSTFTVSTSSSLYSSPVGLLFLYFTVAAAFKLSKACSPDAEYHSYLLSSCYPTPKQRYKFRTQSSTSFFLGHLFLLVPVTPDSSYWFFLRLLINAS